MRRAAADIAAITFDFGNTLVPVARTDLRRAVELTAERVAERLGPFDAPSFLRIWAEERDRQFREEVPLMREVDLGDRYVRVLARLRGMPAPHESDRWDQVAARALSTDAEVTWAVDVYSAAFVEVMPVPRDVGSLLERLSARYTLGVLSNWPLAATVDRYLECAGWDQYFAAVTVSQRVGTIKPDRRIFDVAMRALGVTEPSRMLHVGDDWAADVVGAKAAGWSAAYLDNVPSDSPLPASARDGATAADIEIASLADLEDAIAN